MHLAAVIDESSLLDHRGLPLREWVPIRADKLFFIEYFSQGLYFDIADSVNNDSVSSLIDSANSMLIYFFDLVNVL